MAWLQLVTSVLLAAVIVWRYVTYHASLGQFAQSVAASIEAMPSATDKTAETVESRGVLFHQTTKMLVETRKLIDELQVATTNQARIAPQFAEGVRSAASLASKLSGTVQSIVDAMLIKMATGIRLEGLKPIVIMGRPFEGPAQSLKANAQDLKVVSESLPLASTSG